MSSKQLAKPGSLEKISEAVPSHWGGASEDDESMQSGENRSFKSRFNNSFKSLLHSMKNPESIKDKTLAASSRMLKRGDSKDSGFSDSFKKHHQDSYNDKYNGD